MMCCRKLVFPLLLFLNFGKKGLYRAIVPKSERHDIEVLGLSSGLASIDIQFVVIGIIRTNPVRTPLILRLSP